MPKRGGGRVAAFEILKTNLRIRDLIYNGETEEKTFYQVVESGSAYGMITFDQYLAELFSQNVISEAVAMTNASDKSKLAQMIDKIKAARGEKVTNIDGLELDLEYEKKVVERPS
jgi:twitching motility protein PilT